MIKRCLRLSRPHTTGWKFRCDPDGIRYGRETFDLDDGTYAFAPKKGLRMVDKVLPITESAEADAILERGENRGKVVLKV